ncbi:hypothetical protein GGC47_004834 [Bosea sp. OAE752]
MGELRNCTDAAECGMIIAELAVVLRERDAALEEIDAYVSEPPC